MFSLFTSYLFYFFRVSSGTDKHINMKLINDINITVSVMVICNNFNVMDLGQSLSSLIIYFPFHKIYVLFVTFLLQKCKNM